MNKQQKIPLLLCATIIFFIIIFTIIISNLKNENEILENCQSIIEEQYKEHLNDFYNEVSIDNNTLVYDMLGNAYLKSNNSQIKNKYQEYELGNIIHDDSEQTVDIKTVVSIEAYKLKISSIEEATKLTKNNNDYFIILTEEEKVLYINNKDILTGNITINEIKNLPNIIYITKEEKVLYAVDENRNKYQIKDYIE